MFFTASGPKEWRREKRLDAKAAGPSVGRWLLCALPLLGHMFWQGKDGLSAAKTGQYDRALRRWRDLACGGDAEALYQIGLLHERGAGVSMDTDTVINYFVLAGERCHWRAKSRLARLAKSGNATALYHCGRLLLLGCRNGRAAIGGSNDRDPRKARQWLLRAAEQGHLEAQLLLARTYQPFFFDPKIVSAFKRRDSGMALHWLQEAISRGSAEAEFILGTSYFLGNGVEKDERLGLQLTESAAAKDVTAAQLCLAYLYSTDEHEFVKQDGVVASNWFEQARSHVNGSSSFEVLLWIASAYDEGWGTAVDPIQAYKWYKLASYKDWDQVHALFGKQIKKLRKNMTRNELGAALDSVEAAQGEALILPYTEPAQPPLPFG